MSIPNSYDYNTFAGYIKNEVLQDVALDIGWEYETGADSLEEPFDVATQLAGATVNNAPCIYVDPVATPTLYRNNKIIIGSSLVDYRAVRDVTLGEHLVLTAGADSPIGAVTITLESPLTTDIPTGTVFDFNVAAHNEIQTLTIGKAHGGIVGGDMATSYPFYGFVQLDWPYGFHITFRGQTANFPGVNTGLSAATMQSALEALSTIGAGNVSVTKTIQGTDNIYTVTFQGALAGQDLPLMTAVTNFSPGPDRYYYAGYIKVVALQDGNPAGTTVTTSAEASYGEKVLWVTALAAPIKKDYVANYVGPIKIEVFPYLEGVIADNTAVTLNIKRNLKTHPAYRTITDESLVLLGYNNIASVTGLHDVRKLRMMARIEAWRAVLSVTMGDINYTSEGVTRNRSAIYFSAKEQLRYAEQEFFTVYGQAAPVFNPTVETTRAIPLKAVW